VKLGVCMSGSLSVHVVVLGLIFWLASVPPGMSALEVFPEPGAMSLASEPAPSRPAPAALAAQPGRVAPSRVTAPAAAKQSPDLRPPAATPEPPKPAPATPAKPVVSIPVPPIASPEVEPAPTPPVVALSPPVPPSERSPAVPAEPEGGTKLGSMPDGPVILPAPTKPREPEVIATPPVPPPARPKETLRPVETLPPVVRGPRAEPAPLAGPGEPIELERPAPSPPQAEPAPRSSSPEPLPAPRLVTPSAPAPRAPAPPATPAPAPAPAPAAPAPVIAAVPLPPTPVPTVAPTVVQAPTVESTPAPAPPTAVAAVPAPVAAPPAVPAQAASAPSAPVVMAPAPGPTAAAPAAGSPAAPAASSPVTPPAPGGASSLGRAQSGESREQPAQRTPPPSAPTGSPVGVGLARAIVQFHGPRHRLTERAVEPLAGRIIGPSPDRFTLYVNGSPQPVTVEGRSFAASVALSPGLNRVRVVASGPEGVETEDSVTVEYVPPVAKSRIVLLAPMDGSRLSSDDPPFVVVEGKVEDESIGSVSVVVNGRHTLIPVREGRFRQIVPATDPILKIWAEGGRADGPRQRSEAVTVYAEAPAGSIGILVVDWPPLLAGDQVEVSGSWRGAPGRVDIPTQSLTLKSGGTSQSGRPEVFYLRNLRPGVYTFVLRYRTPQTAGVAQPILYLSVGGTLVPHVLKPVPIQGTGRAIVAKVLLPQGILWEQDDWFSGRSESAETVTKFRVPEGITWTERKNDLR
jgi:hypothetical protein